MNTHGTQNRVKELLRRRNAILLAHNYEPPEIQDAADLCGDSLELSVKASQTDAEIIVFCGVHFMAETASILCPEKKVLLPVLAAGCPMAEMITASQLLEKKRELPQAVVISYVNTSAAVKAESDVCCTSANAVEVAESVEPGRPILMVPDKNLAMYTMNHTDRQITYWDGHCPIHNNLTPDEVKQTRAAHPEALFLAHPECPPGVLELADQVKSTSGMIDFATRSSHREFVIGTEAGILYPLSKANPDKRFIPASSRMICPDMKKITLSDVVRTLEELEPEVRVADDIRMRAIQTVQRMLAVPRA